MEPTPSHASGRPIYYDGTQGEPMEDESTWNAENPPMYDPIIRRPTPGFDFDAGAVAQSNWFPGEGPLFDGQNSSTLRPQTHSAPSHELRERNSNYPQRRYHSENSATLQARYSQQSQSPGSFGGPFSNHYSGHFEVRKIYLSWIHSE